MDMSFLPACPSVHHSVPCAWRPEGGVRLPDLELQIIVNSPVGDRNQTQVLWMNSQCSSPLSLLYLEIFLHYFVNSLKPELYTPERSNV